MSDIKEEQKRQYKRAEENDIKLLQEKIDSLENQLEFIGEQNKYIDKLEYRINKTINYIEEYWKEHGHYQDIDNTILDDLLNILKGDNK